MLVVLGFLLRLIDVSLWVITLGPVKTIMLMLKSSPKVLLACLLSLFTFFVGQSDGAMSAYIAATHATLDGGCLLGYSTKRKYNSRAGEWVLLLYVCCIKACV